MAQSSLKWSWVMVMTDCLLVRIFLLSDGPAAMDFDNLQCNNVCKEVCMIQADGVTISQQLLFRYLYQYCIILCFVSWPIKSKNIKAESSSSQYIRQCYKLVAGDMNVSRCCGYWVFWRKLNLYSDWMGRKNIFGSRTCEITQIWG